MKKLLVLILACLLVQPMGFSGRIGNASSSSANFLKAFSSKYTFTSAGTLLVWMLLPASFPQTNELVGASDVCTTWSFFNITGNSSDHTFFSPTNCTQVTDNGPAPHLAEWEVYGFSFNGSTQVCTYGTTESGGVRTVFSHCTTFGAFTPFVSTNPYIQIGGIQNNSFSIGYMAAFNTVLNGSQISAFANGTSPTQFGSIVTGFYPLDANAFPEVDLSPNAANLTQQGTVTTTPSTFPHGQAGMQRMKHY